jgi:RNA polymerase sigma factor (sigma-70 family)
VSDPSPEYGLDSQGRPRPAPLSPEQAALVEAHEKMCWKMARRFGWGLPKEDVEDLAAEFRMQLVVAARFFEPGRGYTFATYYMQCARQRMLRKARLIRAGGVKVPQRGPFITVKMASTDERWEYGAGGGRNSRRNRDDLKFQIADYRRPARDDVPDPLLHAWCDPEYVEQRKCLHWRTRIVLYLRVVECWSLEEVGRVLGGISRERIRQIEQRSIEKMARSRRRSAARCSTPGDRPVTRTLEELR